MSASLSRLAAQAATEVRLRLRSPATLVALAAFLAGAYLWLPDPNGNATSLSWDTPDGRLQGPVYTAGYVGLGVTLLSSVLIPLAGFYLIAGSVRRDRERGVGAILAATPISKGEYLGGKVAAHTIYLAVVAALGLVAGGVMFLRFGRGAFRLSDFVLMDALVVVPAILFTAAAAVLFDVVPGLRGRGGLVAWFFFFAFFIIQIPILLSGALPGARQTAARLPPYDPSGSASVQVLLQRSLPPHTGSSSGLVFHTKPIERVAWKGVTVDAPFAVNRIAQLLWAIPALALAVLAFDRFDPARRRLRLPRRRSRAADSPETAPSPEASAVASTRLSPVSPAPSAVRATAAETRLLFATASLVKWPLVAAALALALVPAEATRYIAAAFFVLLIPVISEAAAREEQLGTRPLVASQPGIPSSMVLWKAAAVSSLLLLLGAPAALRLAAGSPMRALAWIAGLLFVALFSVSLGSLTAGGKLFSGLFLALWYMAVNGLPEADFAGVLSGAGPTPWSAAWLGAGLLLLSGAWGQERARPA